MTANGYPTIAKAILTAVTTALISGCTLFSPVQSNIQVGLLTQLPLNLPERSTHSATLLVLPPAINPVYDTVRMAYWIRPYQVDYFSRHEWGASPAQMLHPLLAATLENTHYFDTVLTPPYFGPVRFALQTEIQELAQDFTSDPATAHLALRVQLTEGSSNRVIASRVISIHETMLEKTPYAGIVAANKASAKALREVAEFVLETVQ